MMARVNFFAVAIVLAGAGLVSSQSISTSCLTSLKGILVSPDSECLNPSGLFAFALGTNASLATPLNSWLIDFCATGSCNNATLAAIVANVTTGCSTELSAIGVSAASVDIITQDVQEAYPILRSIVCLKDDNTNQLCATELFQDVQTITGTLSVSDLSSMNLLTDINEVMTSGVANIICTSCGKEAYNTLLQDFPDPVSKVNGSLGNLCGSSFIDGSPADGVSETAVENQFSASADNSGAVRLSWGWMRAVGVLVSTSFIFMP